MAEIIGIGLKFDNKPLVNGANKAENALKGLGAAEKQTQSKTKQLERQTKKTATSMQSFGRAAQLARRALGAFAAVAGVGLGIKLITQTIDATESIGKLADRIGIGVEALQELTFVASQAGVSNETLTGSLERFGRRAGEAAAGNKELLEGFTELGISLRDQQGQIKTTNTLFSEASDAFQNVTSQADKLRLVFLLFGRAGGPLLNLLRLGSQGLDDMRQAARRMGLVLSEQTVRGAEAAKDALDKFQRIIKAQVTRGVLQLAPLITQLGESFANITSALRGTNDGFVKLSSNEQVIVNLLTILGETARTITLPLQLLQQSVNLLSEVFSKDLSTRIQNVSAQLRSVQIRLKELEAGGTGGVAPVSRNRLLESLRQQAFDLETQLVRLQHGALTAGQVPSAPGVTPPPGGTPPPPSAETPELTPAEQFLQNLEAQVIAIGKTREELALLELANMNATPEQLKIAEAFLQARLKAERLQKVLKDLKDPLQDLFQPLARKRPSTFITGSLSEQEQQVVEERERGMQLAATARAQSEQMRQEEQIRIAQEEMARIQETLTTFERTGERLGRNLGDFLVDAALRGKFAFKDFATSVIADFLRIQARTTLSGLLGTAFKTIGNLFVSPPLTGPPPTQFGGPVSAGMPRLVGEKRPEVFVPDVPGRIVPSIRQFQQDTSTQSKTVVHNNTPITITIISDNPTSFARSRGEIDALIVGAVRKAQRNQ